jgi:hypothetical protein
MFTKFIPVFIPTTLTTLYSSFSTPTCNFQIPSQFAYKLLQQCLNYFWNRNFIVSPCSQTSKTSQCQNKILMQGHMIMTKNFNKAVYQSTFFHREVRQILPTQQVIVRQDVLCSHIVQICK